SPQSKSNGREQVGGLEAEQVSFLTPQPEQPNLAPLGQADQALQSEPAPKSGVQEAVSQPAKSTKCMFSGIVPIDLKRFLESGVALMECPDCKALRTLEPHAGVLRFKSHDKRKTKTPNTGQRWARVQTDWGV